jgi:hypothetical protein
VRGAPFPDFMLEALNPVAINGVGTQKNEEAGRVFLLLLYN